MISERFNDLLKKIRNRKVILLFIASLALPVLYYTKQKSVPTAIKIIRPVRTITAEYKNSAQVRSLTGEIRAKNVIDYSFRIGGKVIERLVSVGDSIAVGQVVARIDPKDAEDDLISAKSNLAAAQALLAQASNNEARQKILLSKGIIANAQYDDATTKLQSARSNLETQGSNLNHAQNNLDYSNLRVDVAGIVTATKAEAGEVVKSGQIIVSVATDAGRDAVFNVPEQLFQQKTSNPIVEITLASDPSIKTTGHIREISPQADSISRTFLVKVELNSMPPQMKLGSTIIGSIGVDKGLSVELPVMSLNKLDKSAAVWVVNPSTNVVELRKVTISGYTEDKVMISEGLKDGEIVVIAGVHSLYIGQEVKLLDDSNK